LKSNETPLKKARRATGIKQSELAELLNTTQGNISQLESSSSYAEVFKAYLKYLSSHGQDMNELIPKM